MITVIGNAPVDLIASVDDDFLIRYGIAKGICTTITQDQEKSLLEAADYMVVPGGCGANTAASLALLGEEVRFSGPFGIGPYGEISRNSLTALDIECIDYTQPISNQIIFTFLTADGDRSFAAFYHSDTGVPFAVLQDFMKESKGGWLVIDGYSLLYPRHRDTIVQYITHAGHSPAQTLFCPNDTSVMEEAQEACLEVHRRSSHIVMNCTELLHLYKGHDFSNTLNILRKNKDSGAITNGADGACLFNQKGIINVPSVFDPAQFIDSNGAGDAFTAGYIYGLVHKWTLERQGGLASLCAAEVLASRGARPPLDLRARVLKEIL